MPPPSLRATASRHCTPCTVCCVALPVPEGLLGPECKPAGVACQDLGPRGCLRYASRPAVCSGFRCAWLADRGWPESWRPDRSGLLCLREDLLGTTPAAAVYEVVAGALAQPVASDILRALRHTTAAVALVHNDGRREGIFGEWNPAEAAPALREVA